MLRLILLIILCSLTISFLTTEDQGVESSPSPHGDTRMGADATGLGKDLSADTLRSQEDSPLDFDEQDELGKKSPTEKDDEKMDVQ